MMRALLVLSLSLSVACARSPSSRAPSTHTPPPTRTPIGSGTPDSQQQTPPDVGFLDDVDASGVAAGWAYSRADAAKTVAVTIEVDGAVVGTVDANDPRADVDATLGITGDHGFHFALPASIFDDNAHVVSAFIGAIELTQSPMSVTFSHCRNAGDVVAPDPSEYVVTLLAANGKYVSADCGGDDVGNVFASAGAAGDDETFYVRAQPGGQVSIRSSHGRDVSAEAAGGALVHANRTAVGPWELFALAGRISEGNAISLRAGDGVHFVSARIDQDPPLVDAEATALGPWEQFAVHVIAAPAIVARPGIVHADGNNYADDAGAFYPLGATLMWAVWGWQNDQDRVKQNLDFLAQHHWDYVRILGEVDWSNETIDPNSPGYQAALGELIDYAYDVDGLRTEITLMGGSVDPMITAQQVVPVVNANRAHKILDLEVANESYLRPVSLDQLQNVGRYLRSNTQNLVAISSGEGWSTYQPNATDWLQAYKDTYIGDFANLGTVHMDRGQGDGGWREVRQPWDWKDLSFPMSHNEPIGPRSSVAEEVDPIRLSMLRAVGLINGVGAFVLHNGAGVAGQVDPAHNRPANLWEVPGIDAIMDAVRSVDEIVPLHAGDGQHWNNAWAGNPLVADAFWSDGDDHGVNRNYTVSTADGWISTEAGVEGYVVLTVRQHARVEIFDVLLGKVNEVEVQSGDTVTLTPSSLDSNGDGAFVVVGHYL